MRDPEIKFGYAVTGLVDPRRMLTNAGGRPGQVLVLTKPLGTGIIATALKAGAAPAEAAEASAASMRTLNRAAAEAALRHGVTAATDVTGFGLAGHAAAIARESRLTLEITSSALPLLPGVLELALRFQAGGLKANRRAFEPQLEYQGTLDEAVGGPRLRPADLGRPAAARARGDRGRAPRRAARRARDRALRESQGPRALVLRAL